MEKLAGSDERIPCAPLPGAGSLKGALCGEVAGHPAMSTRPRPTFPLEYREWIEIAPSTYFNIWNSSVARYPVYLSKFLGRDDLTLVTVAGAGASVPTAVTQRGGALTPANEARAAGATRGAGYTSAKDVRTLATIRQTGKSATVTLSGQTLAVTVGQRVARLNGKPVTLQGAPFVLYGQVYYPVGLFKLLGCTVTPVVNEAGVASAMDVTCLVGGQPRTALVESWVF